MAEAFLQIVLRNLNTLIQDEIGMIMGVDDEMKKLFSTFTTIQAVLEDAEEKQLESKPVRNWLCKLTDLAYEIDDILDECATHVSKLKLRDGKLSRYSVEKIMFQHKIGRKMKKVTKKLDAVAAEREKFHLREMDVDKPREVAAARETGSILNDSHQVFGRDEDKEEIVDILLNRVKENQKMSVLPIIGVGGLGKTTLAQLVFNDNCVTEHFDRKLWICVSDNFDLKTLVRAMIESATGSGSASDLMQLDTLQRRLWDLLNGKRYLLVLDDVWNTAQEKWFVLKNMLACGSNGTSIIVTTRLKMIADIMGTLPPHRLKELSEEHCWLLLKERAFREEETEEYPNLEVIGRQIVKKCAGVPMAAKALGGLLRFKRTEKEWNYVKESELWNLAPEETLILPALRLSYHHLPLALRRCFAYFAVFPKDFSIRKEELVFLWIAHGYIPSRRKLEVEDVGTEICNELVLRSLFQYHPFFAGEIIMHDLVHDLAQSIMEGKVPGEQVERQLTIASYSRIRQVNLQKKSVAFPTSVQQDMDISSILMKFSHLRVLDANRTEIQDLPSTVRNLKHMRFLNLSDCEIHTLPKSLCSLWNLQILNLNGCWRLVALPKNMRCLNNLRHLFLESCDSLREMPSKIGELTRLRTLSLFIVGCKRGNKLEELQSLNLGGKLEIKHLERVESYMDAKKANLVEKIDLRDLSLEWEINIKSRDDIDEKVLEALRPHPNLEILRIRGFGGRSLPVWVADSAFIKMIRIEIVDCQNCLHLPQLGRLPHLEYLKLEKLGVEYIVEGGSLVSSLLFPSLSKLELMSLPNLKGVVKEEQANTEQVLFQKLVDLKIYSCSSFTLPQLPSLQELDVRDCSSLMMWPFSNMDTTASLKVAFGENMKSVPFEMLEKLDNLKSLTIYKPEETSLPEEGLRALKSLSHLWIEGSETMTCLPPQGWLPHLSALTMMTIKDCSEFVELPEEIKDLHHLETVHFFNVPKMVCLPKALQHLSSLKHLDLQILPQLNSLPDWLHNLTSLFRLFIDDCPKLVSLPASIRGMPNLQILIIDSCPELKRRCKRGTGEDWHKISHIRYQYIASYFSQLYDDSTYDVGPTCWVEPPELPRLFTNKMVNLTHTRGGEMDLCPKHLKKTVCWAEGKRVLSTLQFLSGLLPLD